MNDESRVNEAHSEQPETEASEPVPSAIENETPESMSDMDAHLEADDSFVEGNDDYEKAERSRLNPAEPVDEQRLAQIIEGALLAIGQPMTIARLRTLFDEEVAPSNEDIRAALGRIEAANVERGFELKEVGSGFRLQVRPALAPWINRLWEEKPQRYSRALLETLALIAYRQPITRGDIEEIRGVAVSSHIMKTLMERDWVKVVGQRDVPGRPSLYATTRQFLDYFNLKSLDELPSLGDIRDLDELNAELDLGIEAKVASGSDQTEAVQEPTDTDEEAQEYLVVEEQEDEAVDAQDAPEPASETDIDEPRATDHEDAAHDEDQHNA
ncbi:SMC-Scp complex subunit ScpB [Marinimicrobium alkaliphilum]|uniref:SMC-Scp complex subunit ScpB n=1 Tax=Marinimicrobium alkaliphilum TaxID=2202654 RepID=UPI001E64EA63|nr:SMC-Scp complex subunit ScpB [Marinimicrobium alkaliphilum]